MCNLFTSECISSYRVSNILCHPRCIIRSLPQFSELVYYIFHGPLLPLHLALIHISFSAILVVAWKTVLYYFRLELFMTQFVVRVEYFLEFFFLSWILWFRIFFLYISIVGVIKKWKINYCRYWYCRYTCNLINYD